MKQLNGQTISTSQHLRDLLLHSDSREMFSVPPEVVAAQCRLQQQFRDDCFVASCAQLATRQSALVAPLVQASLQPPPGIAASVSGSGYSEKQATTSMNNNTSGINGSKGDRYKTELCRTYEECGTCRYGDKCQFAHGIAELRNVVRHPKYKTDLCRTFHTSGFCPYGARCHFIHGEQEKPPCAPQQQAATSSSPLVRQQQVPAARRPEVLDLLYDADRQNELTSFVNTVTSLLSLNGQNQRSQQQPAPVRQTGSHQFQMQTTSSNENSVATYELLRMMVEQQLSLTQSKTLLSPCPSPTISQYGSVCSAGSTDDIPSPVCSPSLSSSLSSLSSSNGNWNAFFKQQASFDSLSSYSNSSGGGSSRRTPPGSPDSQTMHWQDRDAARDFRLWPSTESVGCSMQDEVFLSRQNAIQMKSNLLLSNRAVRSIFSN